MNNPDLYRAFGMTISSEFPIVQLQKIANTEPDVRIVSSDLSALTEDEKAQCRKQGAAFITGVDQTIYRVTNGSLIEVSLTETSDSKLTGVYLMGSCMGAILHQRGLMPLHGSCITDGKRSILITGDSGAGKSTLAAEFLKQGWKLITDDVTAVFDVDKTPMVQSSYPSQKLWKDALDHYDRPEEDIHSLYVTQTREKFGVNVSGFFHEGTAELSMVIRLIPADHACVIAPIKGMAKVDQLMQNTYRPRMIEPGNVQRHFQRCVTLSTKIPMALAIRENGKQCADILYKLITDYLGGQNHE